MNLEKDRTQYELQLKDEQRRVEEEKKKVETEKNHTLKYVALNKTVNAKLAALLAMLRMRTTFQ